MVWYYALIGIAATIATALLIAWVRRRYIDVEMVKCTVCGTKYREHGSCPRCGGR